MAVQDGQYSKAIKALTSNGLATPSREVLQEMLSKHPQSGAPTLPPGPAPTPASLLTSAVRQGVLSFPHGSAPGPSALRPSHLREAVRCPSLDQADRLLAALTNVVNLLAAGQAPPTINPFLCGASLLASRKKSGGHRPIAVGESCGVWCPNALLLTSDSLPSPYSTPYNWGLLCRVAVKQLCTQCLRL